MQGKLIRLRWKQAADAARDYAWQTDDELCRLDACTRLPMSFREYSREYEMALRRTSPRRRMYAVETLEGRHIGNCVYHENDFGGDATEIGIMIGEREYWDRGYGSDAIRTLVRHIFEDTTYRRIVLKTLAWNERARRCFTGCGFTEYGHHVVDGYDFIFMELTHLDWQQAEAAAAAAA